MRATLDLPGADFTAELWFSSALPPDVRPLTGVVLSLSALGRAGTPGGAREDGVLEEGVPEQVLALGGSEPPGAAGRLLFAAGDSPPLLGRTPIAPGSWHHVALVRAGDRVRIHLDGAVEPEIEGTAPSGAFSEHALVLLGGRRDGLFGLEGRVDEAAIYPRALPAEDVRAHREAAGR